jgi:hypothetical protein
VEYVVTTPQYLRSQPRADSRHLELVTRGQRLVDKGRHTLHWRLVAPLQARLAPGWMLLRNMRKAR